MSNETNIKFQYKIKNVPMTILAKLNNNESLENNFNIYKNNQNDNELKNTTDYEFNLVRENTNILLDKNIKIKDLNLKEGDLILVSFKPISNEINEINNIRHIHNTSSANLNEEINQNSTELTVDNTTKYIIIITDLILIILIGLAAFLMYYFIFRSKKDNKKIIVIKDLPGNSKK